MDSMADAIKKLPASFTTFPAPGSSLLNVKTSAPVASRMGLCARADNNRNRGFSDPLSSPPLYFTGVAHQTTHTPGPLDRLRVRGPDGEVSLPPRDPVRPGEDGRPDKADPARGVGAGEHAGGKGADGGAADVQGAGLEGREELADDAVCSCVCAYVCRMEVVGLVDLCAGERQIGRSVEWKRAPRHAPHERVVVGQHRHHRPASRPHLL